jgi:hypothetical protein
MISLILVGCSTTAHYNEYSVKLYEIGDDQATLFVFQEDAKIKINTKKNLLYVKLGNNETWYSINDYEYKYYKYYGLLKEKEDLYYIRLWLDSGFIAYFDFVAECGYIENEDTHIYLNYNFELEKQKK